MKTTGIIRKIDHLGRIVIPKEMCRTLHISSGDALEFSLEGKKVVITKHETGCVFCDSTDGLTAHNGKFVCAKCRDALANL